MTRRISASFLLVLLTVSTLAAPTALLAQEASKKATTLKEAVGDRFKIGVGISDDIALQKENWPLLKSQFQIITPENCMKPQGVQPTEGNFNFDKCDEFVNFAVDNDLEIVGHCLVWAKDDRTSEWWMKDADEEVSAEKLLERMKTHIDTVAGRYAGKIAMWDVVNEALSDGDGDYLRDSIWSRKTNEEFIVKAFQYAKAAAPEALLIYNDYNCFQPAKREKLIRLIKSLKEQGAPVEAFGFQGHFELDKIAFDDIEATIVEMRKLGVKVVVSELDIDVVLRSKWWAEDGKYRDELASYDPYKDGCPEEISQQLADRYAQMFAMFVKHEDVIERVSFWNLHDGQSWLNYFPWDRTNYPLLFDRQRQPKPAFDAVIKVLEEK